MASPIRPAPPSYVNGAVAKVGRAAPYMRFQRYFFRQIIGLGGEARQEDPDTGSLSETLRSTVRTSSRARSIGTGSS